MKFALSLFLVFSTILLPAASSQLLNLRTPALITLFLAVLLLPWTLPYLQGARRRKVLMRVHAGVIPRKSVASKFGFALLILNFFALIRGAFGDDAEVSKACVVIILTLVGAAYSFIGVMRLYKGSIKGFVPLTVTCWALAVILLLSLLLWAVGVQNPNAADNQATSQQATLLALVGIHMNRIFPPLGNGVNTTAIAAGAVFVFGACKLLSGGRERFFIKCVSLFMLIVVPFVCLLLTDARAAILMSFVAIAISILPRRLGIYIAIFLVVVDALLLLNIDFVSNIALGGATRDNSTGFLTGRDIIWLANLAPFASFEFVHLFGYGAFGQVASGGASALADFFESWGDSAHLISTHNSVVQALVDTGYIGVILLFSFVISFFAFLKKSPSYTFSQKRVGTGVMAYMVLQGFTEISLNPENIWASVIFMAIIFMTTERVVVKSGINAVK